MTQTHLHIDLDQGGHVHADGTDLLHREVNSPKINLGSADVYQSYEPFQTIPYWYGGKDLAAREDLNLLGSAVLERKFHETLQV